MFISSKLGRALLQCNELEICFICDDVPEYEIIYKMRRDTHFLKEARRRRAAFRLMNKSKVGKLAMLGEGAAELRGPARGNDVGLPEKKEKKSSRTSKKWIKAKSNAI